VNDRYFYYYWPFFSFSLVLFFSIFKKFFIHLLLAWCHVLDLNELLVSVLDAIHFVGLPANLVLSEK